MVSALKPVTHAILGDKTDMFRPIEEIQPAIITIGFNQHFDESKLQIQLSERGLTPKVVRIGKYEDGILCSSRFVVQRIIEVRGTRIPVTREADVICPERLVFLPEIHKYAERLKGPCN